MKYCMLYENLTGSQAKLDFEAANDNEALGIALDTCIEFKKAYAEQGEYFKETIFCLKKLINLSSNVIIFNETSYLISYKGLLDEVIEKITATNDIDAIKKAREICEEKKQEVRNKGYHCRKALYELLMVVESDTGRVIYRKK